MALVADVRVQKETTNFPKYVGYFEGEVVGINPTPSEWEEIYGTPAKKEIEYLKIKDGVANFNVLVVLRDVKTKNLFQLRFWLKDVKKVGSRSGKKQYVNTVGNTTWAFDEDSLDSRFLKDGREFRQAYEKEEQFLKFLRVWLGGLDFNTPEAMLQLNWKKLMSGNIDEWKEYIGHDWTKPVGCLATIKLDDEPTKQNVFDGAFFQSFNIKQYRQFDYTDENLLEKIKNGKGLQRWEWFIRDIISEYGPKEYYVLKELSVYDPNNSPENGKVISDESSDF